MDQVCYNIKTILVLEILNLIKLKYKIILVDPNTGTSTMLEISRVLMNLKQKKIWSPKRSIIFLSWSAEEVGSQGSTEWVEVT